MKTSIKSILGAIVLSAFVGFSATAQEGEVGTEQDPLEPTEQEIGQDQSEYPQDQNPQEFDDTQQLGQEEGKTQISPEALPAEVTESIATGDYAEWRIAKAFKLDETNHLEAKYEIHFEDPQGMVETEMYNEEGKVVDA